MSLLAGLDSPDNGSIEILGQDLASLDESARTRFRAQHMGIVFQQFHLMPHLTALENVTLALDILKRPGALQKAKEFLELVGLGHRMDHRPNQLSGGECQRVAIARASVVEPKYLLADEPSGNLDTDTGVKVMDLLFDLSQQKKMGLVLVTHDPKLADRCDQKVSLLGGRQQ